MGFVVDFRLALRRLRQSPAFSVFAVLTLAMGTSITSVAYSAIRIALWPKPPVDDTRRIVAIKQTAGYLDDFAGPELLALQSSEVFERVGAWMSFTSALSSPQASDVVSGEAVSGTFFSVLGLRPWIGRLIQHPDDNASAQPVVVLSYPCWLRLFGGREDAVGSYVTLAGKVFTIVGVAPSEFNGVTSGGRRPQDIWIALEPYLAARTGNVLATHSNRDLNAIGRLRRPENEHDLESFLRPLAARLDKLMPLHRRVGSEDRRLLVQPAFWQLRSELADLGKAVIVIPGLVFLIACTNLTNLGVARVWLRRHDVPIRRALGATRWRLVREQMVESGVVVVVGGCVGWLGSRALLSSVVTYARQTLGWIQWLNYDWRVSEDFFTGAALSMAIALVLISIIPAIQATGSRAAPTPSPYAGAALRWRQRSNLLSMQVAISVALFILTAAGVMYISSYSPALHGEARRIAVVEIPYDIQGRLVPDEEASVRQIMDRAALSANVANVGAISSLRYPGRPITVSVRPNADPVAGVQASEFFMTHSLLPMLGLETHLTQSIPGARDSSSVVITKSLSRTVLANKGLGETILISSDGGKTTQEALVVGVVDNDLALAGNRHVVYRQTAAVAEPTVMIMALSRTAEIKHALAALKDAIDQVDRTLAVTFSGSLEGALTPTPVLILRLVTSGVAVLATIAFGLAMTGLYGVLMQLVCSRQREWGIRLAVGATPSDIIWLVVRDGVRPVVHGLIVGFSVAATACFVGQAALPESLPLFLFTRAVLPCAFLLLVAVIACSLPAVKAARTEPRKILEAQ